MDQVDVEHEMPGPLNDAANVNPGQQENGVAQPAPLEYVPPNISNRERMWLVSTAERAADSVGRASPNEYPRVITVL